MKEKSIISALIIVGAILGLCALYLAAKDAKAHDYDHNKELCNSVGGKLMLSREFGRVGTFCEVEPHEI